MTDTQATITSAWSASAPDLQIALDQTSLSAFMTCERYYKLAIIEGWRQPMDVHLTFGGMYAECKELGRRVLAKTGSHDEAQLAAVRLALEISVIRNDKTGEWEPWGGNWVPHFRCTHKPKKGERRCKWALRNKWHMGQGKETCGVCGSPMEQETRWTPWKKHEKKNRLALVRAISWYWEEEKESNLKLKPYVFPDGTTGAEVSFRLPLPLAAYTGEQYWLVGHLDGIGSWGEGETWLVEDKTTGHGLGRFYFDRWSPSMQIDTYDAIGSILFPELGIQGVLLEAAALGIDSAQFARQPLRRTEAMREEHMRDIIETWVPRMEEAAKTGHYPKRKSQCAMCMFKGICSKEDEAARRFLKADFVQNRWDPWKER